MVSVAEAWTLIAGEGRTEPGWHARRIHVGSACDIRSAVRAPDGIVAHALHPGTIDSNFITHADESSQAHIRTLEAMSPAQGSDALTWLAVGDEAATGSGGYFHQRRRMPPNPFAEDEAAVERLWAESERLVMQASS